MNLFSQRGTEAELLFAAEAIKRGYTVSFPVSHDSRYDALIDNGKAIYRCQIKRAYATRNRWFKRSDEKRENPSFYELFSVEMRRRAPGRETQGTRYDKNDFDFLVACGVENRDFWIIPMKVAMTYKSNVYLTGRTEAAKYKNTWM